jgi:kinesin family protein 2/24
MSRQNRCLKQIYEQDVAGLVGQAFEGVKITVFAYGQTGSGKTHTMMGNSGSPGLYLMTVEDIFARKQPHHKVYVSFYEIYCSQLYDLLHERAKLVLREDANSNINVVGIMTIEVANPDELLQCIDKGNEQRITSTTSANYDSSRSHSILQIRIIEGTNEVGKLCFIDLAGNERGADTYDNDKQTRVDGAEINKSLLALKECIRALDQGGKHTPFRGSKLTLVLKDSFIGNCRTMMIANIAPSNSCCELTLNTLRYADRVKELSAVKSGGKKDDNLSNRLMLPRQDKLSKQGSEANDKRKPESRPAKPEKQPKPLDKAVYSFQEINRNGSFIPPNPSTKEQIKNPKSDQKVAAKAPRQRSDSVHKGSGKNQHGSSSRDTAPTRDNGSKNLKANDDLGFYDPRGLKKKKLLPIPVKQPTPVAPKPNSMLPKKAAAQQFTILTKYFKRPIESLSNEEIKNAHLAIIDDMIVYEENFLADHRSCTERLQECTKKHQRTVDRFEEQTMEIDAYLNDTEKTLEVEFQSTNALKSKLRVFKRYLFEENLFAKKYICDPRDPRASKETGSNEFEIKSHDSLLLDDS